jgi:hypothetical protein
MKNAGQKLLIIEANRLFSKIKIETKVGDRRMDQNCVRFLLRSTIIFIFLLVNACTAQRPEGITTNAKPTITKKITSQSSNPIKNPTETQKAISPTALPTKPLTPTQIASTSTTKPNVSVNTNSWLLYKNTYFGYTLNYPPTLFVSGDAGMIGSGPSEYFEVYISNDPNAWIKTSTPLIFIFSDTKEFYFFKDMSLAEIVKLNYEANINSKNSPAQMIGAIERFTFSGQPAYRYQMINDSYSGEWLGVLFGNESLTTVIEVEHNGFYFIICYSDDPTLEKVISTFTFSK